MPDNTNNRTKTVSASSEMLQESERQRDKFKEDWQVSFNKGLFQFLILGVFKRHEKEGVSGIQIIREISAFSDSTLNVALGTIYPLLKRMEKKMDIIEQVPSDQLGKSRSRQKVYRPKNNLGQFDDIYNFVSNRYNLLQAYVNQLTPETGRQEQIKEAIKPTVVTQQFLTQLGILSILKEEQKHLNGIELRRKFRRKYGKEMELSIGKLYAVLHSLEAREYITRIASQDFQFPDRQISFYLMTNLGKQYLEEIGKQWGKIDQTMQQLNINNKKKNKQAKKKRSN